MTEPLAPLSLRVAEARLLNPLIRMFRLQAADGGVLPPWEPETGKSVLLIAPFSAIRRLSAPPPLSTKRLRTT